MCKFTPCLAGFFFGEKVERDGLSRALFNLLSCPTKDLADLVTIILLLSFLVVPDTPSPPFSSPPTTSVRD